MGTRSVTPAGRFIAEEGRELGSRFSCGRCRGRCRGSTSTHRTSPAPPRLGGAPGRGGAVFHRKATGLIWDGGLDLPLFPPSLRVCFSPPSRLLRRCGGGEHSPGPVRGESVRAARSGTTPRLCPLPSPSSFASHCVRMSSALPRPRARCQQRWPGWKISPAPPGGNWVSRSDGSDGSRAGTRGTEPVIQRVPAAPSEPGLIQQGQGALLLQARPLGHPLFAGKIKNGVFFIV